jgi:hypothetical protein
MQWQTKEAAKARTRLSKGGDPAVAFGSELTTIAVVIGEP